jgi:ABC-2 type transport system ATP-binding protein
LLIAACFTKHAAPMIEAEGLTKRFGDFTAIENVSFRVDAGEIVGFLGPNGAGKSTTMRILGGVFPPTQGRASVAGHDVVRDSLRARQALGYFPERVSLYADMTVREFLQYCAAIKRVSSASREGELKRVMERCGVEHMAHRLIGTLSKGYRQRVGIAQALVGKPPVLILDEPTAGLDPEQVAEVRQLIRELKGHSTVILSTHILPEVEATCDRVMIINRGRILAVDTPQRLSQRLQRLHEIHVALRGPTPEAAVTALGALPGVLRIERLAQEGEALMLRVHTSPDRDLRGAIAELVVGRGWKLLELRPVQLSLEEIFLKLVHDEAAAA